MKADVLAEFAGTGVLLLVVVGSGIMGERLAGGNDAIALLANSLATGGGLYLLIVVLGPVSGAQLNPAVSLLLAATGRQSRQATAAFIAAQFVGAVAGVLLAHAMFGEPLVQLAGKARDGAGLWLSEVVATAGLLAVILSGLRAGAGTVAVRVAVYVATAYWFTASTSFANPAVTVARMFTDSFTGIAPGSTPGFLAAQLLATVLVASVARSRSPGRAAASSRN